MQNTAHHMVEACWASSSCWPCACLSLPTQRNHHPSCAGAAMRKAARPSSKRTRAIPTRVVGFEVEVAALLAEGLGREPRFLQVGFTSLDAAAARGDFDIGLSGIEDSPARQSRLAVTIPYYQFREVLTVRDADAASFRTLADLRGRRVATLGATLAYDLLVDAQSRVRRHACRLRRRCASVYRPGAGARRCRRCSTTSSPSAESRRNPGLTNQVDRCRHRLLRRHHARRTNTALRDQMNDDPASARCRTAGSKRSSAAGTCGTTISPGLYARLLSGQTGARRRPAAGSAIIDRMGRSRAISSCASARGRDHARAVVSLDGARRRDGRR